MITDGGKKEHTRMVIFDILVFAIYFPQPLLDQTWSARKKNLTCFGLGYAPVASVPAMWWIVRK